MPSPLLRFCCLGLFVAGLMARYAAGQELRGQPSPLTAWLDLRPAPAGALPQTTPPWIESFDFIPARPATAVSASVPGGPSSELAATPGVDRSRSVYRIRVQRPAANVNELQMRVFFEDSASGSRPSVSVWNELGQELMQSSPLGQGLGLPSSETLTVPMTSADYVEISADGDGSQVRGVFLSWLEKSRILQPADFPSTEAVREPFHILGATPPERNDSYLFGVVTANLQGADPAVLKRPTAADATFEFELEHQPLVAIINYEVLGASLETKLDVRVNQQAQGTAEIRWPDLADPGYRGEQHEAESQLGFRYTGWVHAQKTISGEALHAGLNSLALSLSQGSQTVAIRALSIQLKYNWEKFDYILVSPSPHEDH